MKLIAAAIGTGIGLWLASFFGPLYPATFIIVAVVMAYISYRLDWLSSL